MGGPSQDSEEVASLRRSIGAAMRPAREARGLTQDQAAELFGITSEFYGRLERGHAMPSVAMLVTIADGLGLSVDSMLAQRSPEPRQGALSPEKQHIVDVCRARPSVRRLVMTILQVFAERESGS